MFISCHVVVGVRLLIGSGSHMIIKMSFPFAKSVMKKLVCLRSFGQAVSLGRTQAKAGSTILNEALKLASKRNYSSMCGSYRRPLPQMDFKATPQWPQASSSGTLQLASLMSGLSLGGGISREFTGIKTFKRPMSSLNQLHRDGPHKKIRKRKRPLDGRPMMKGVVLKTLIKKPRKPNSANRKCVLVRLSNGKEMVAFVPGEGHNLQEHNIVLVQCGRLQDTPGVWLEVIRGKYDCAHVVKKTQISK